jgi:hypothetical protein
LDLQPTIDLLEKVRYIAFYLCWKCFGDRVNF